MKIRIIIFLVIFASLIPCLVMSNEIEGQEVIFTDNNLKVSLTLLVSGKQIQLIKDGIQKEFIFSIDLFRKWKIWPDEFIKGKKIIRTIKADSVKDEYIVTSLEGLSISEKRFVSFDSMLKWALNISDVSLMLTDLSPTADYFIRVTIESYKRKLPKIIGYVLFFIDKKDIKIEKDSETFKLVEIKKTLEKEKE